MDVVALKHTKLHLEEEFTLFLFQLKLKIRVSMEIILVPEYLYSNYLNNFRSAYRMWPT